jgi:hypothetical protein
MVDEAAEDAAGSRIAAFMSAPEHETWGLQLAGLGLVGFAVRHHIG